jgi:hypothetical protein
MAFRIIQTGNNLPHSWPVDPSAEFEPGQIAQLTVIGNQIVATVSNGSAPLGIIDDIKTNSFSSISWDEEVIVAATGVIGPNNRLITPVDIKQELKNPNIEPSSFVSDPVSVQLIPRNGIVVFPAGTELNFDMLGTGTPNAIRTVVRYSFQIPNIPGDDSTLGSGRVTIWFSRMLAATDVFDSSAFYSINANLFVNERGLLTTKQPAPNYPSVAIVTAIPSPIIPMLEFLWL